MRGYNIAVNASIIIM